MVSEQSFSAINGTENFLPIQTSRGEELNEFIRDITLTPQEQALIMRLKSFRVPEMAYPEEQLKDPNANLNTFMERDSNG